LNPCRGSPGTCDPGACIAQKSPKRPHPKTAENAPSTQRNAKLCTSPRSQIEFEVFSFFGGKSPALCGGALLPHTPCNAVALPVGEGQSAIVFGLVPNVANRKLCRGGNLPVRHPDMPPVVAHPNSPPLEGAEGRGGFMIVVDFDLQMRIYWGKIPLVIFYS